MQIKKGYKQTTEISTDITIRLLGILLETGQNKKKLNNDEIVTLIKMEDVSEDGKVHNSTEILFLDVKKGLTYFEKGNILVAKITPCFENGKGACLDNLKTEKGFGSTEFHVLKAKDNVIPKYIFYHTQNTIFRKKLETEMVGTAGQKRVPLSAIINYPLSIIHCLEEQHAIAAALSDVDALISSLDQLITKKRNIKQGAMQELLTGKNTVLWKTTSIKDSATLKARIGWQGLTTAEYLKAGKFYLITGTDFSNGKINWDGCHYVDEKRYSQDRNIQLKVNDILITKDGTIGKIAYVSGLPANATLNSGIFVVRPKENKFFPLFFFYILNSIYFDSFLKQLAAGSTISHLYQKDFVNFSFPLPSYEEQQAIAAILSDMDAEIEKLEQQRDKYKAIKQGMMQELLTGKTRLI